MDKNKTLFITHKASLKKAFGIEADCYVLNDKTRIIGQRGMAEALALKSGGSTGFSRAISGKILSKYIGSPLKGYKAEILIDVCKSIITAKMDNALIDNLTGYDAEKEEYIELFKYFIAEEAKEYQKEFPREFYLAFYDIYELDSTQYKNHPQFFAGITRKYIYKPLANSNGAILMGLDKKNPIIYKPEGTSGRKYKLFQFLEDIGLNALRIQIGQIIAIANLSKNKADFKRKFNKLFGKEPEFDFMYDFEEQQIKQLDFNKNLKQALDYKPN